MDLTLLGVSIGASWHACVQLLHLAFTARRVGHPHSQAVSRTCLPSDALVDLGPGEGRGVREHTVWPCMSLSCMYTIGDGDAELAGTLFSPYLLDMMSGQSQLMQKAVKTIVMDLFYRRFCLC